MKEAQRIETGEDCFVCGSGMVALTKAPQRCGCDWCSSGVEIKEHEATWWAFDGDEVKCEECGADGWVSEDDGTVRVSYDEMSEHNIACAVEYESSRK